MLGYDVLIGSALSAHPDISSGLTSQWTDPTPIDKFCPHDEACSKSSGLMPPDPVVEHFNVIDDIGPGDIQYPTHRHHTPYSAVFNDKSVVQSGYSKVPRGLFQDIAFFFGAFYLRL